MINIVVKEVRSIVLSSKRAKIKAVISKPFIALLTLGIILSPSSNALAQAVSAITISSPYSSQVMGGNASKVSFATGVLPYKGTLAPRDSYTDSVLTADKKIQKNGKVPNKAHVKELPINRSSFTRTYQNADGSNTLEVSKEATGYQDDTGAWQDIDNTLTQDPFTHNWTNKANSLGVQFGSLSTSNGLSLTIKGATLKMMPVNGQASDPTVEGLSPHQFVVYKNVWPNVDLRYVVSGSGLKESIWINGPTTQRTFQFKIEGSTLSSDVSNKGYTKLNGAFSGYEFTAPSIATASTPGTLGTDPYI